MTSELMVILADESKVPESCARSVMGALALMQAGPAGNGRLFQIAQYVHEGAPLEAGLKRQLQHWKMLNLVEEIEPNTLKVLQNALVLNPTQPVKQPYFK